MDLQEKWKHATQYMSDALDLTAKKQNEINKKLWQFKKSGKRSCDERTHHVFAKINQLYDIIFLECEG